MIQINLEFDCLNAYNLLLLSCRLINSWDAIIDSRIGSVKNEL